MEIDYQGLQKYLLTLNYRRIKNGGLVTGHSRPDIEKFYPSQSDKRGITLDQVIEYGDPFLVDALGNDLSVCILTKRRYKLPTGRVVNMRFGRVLIDDANKAFGSPVNGYWIIPEKFIR